MQPNPVYYLTCVITPKQNYYLSIKPTPEAAREDLYQFAQKSWPAQFPGVEMPSSKEDVIEQYFQAVKDIAYYKIVDLKRDDN